MAMSLKQGRRITLSRVDAFADGVAVKHVSVVAEVQQVCLVPDGGRLQIAALHRALCVATMV
jgi:hypothetical protein